MEYNVGFEDISTATDEDEGLTRFFVHLQFIRHKKNTNAEQSHNESGVWGIFKR